MDAEARVGAEVGWGRRRLRCKGSEWEAPGKGG